MNGVVDEGFARVLAFALGPTGAAMVLAVVVRHWFGEKLRKLERLHRRAEQDRLWKAMAGQRFDAQTAEIDRLSRNLHHLKNWCTNQAANVHNIGARLQDRGVDLELADSAPPQWEVAQLPIAHLPAELVESTDHEDDEK